MLRSVVTAALTAAALLTDLPAGLAAPPDHEQDFLTRVRRLTVEGRRAGEGYWSPDGGRLVFQSEREPGNPFYQIYVMDLASGETSRISTGLGKTTCAFFRPGTDQIEFASTHADPKSKEHQDEELAIRASGRERRYSWDYDPEMDIYSHDGKTGELKRLTTAKGYDAEGSYSPDGQWIVFSSMRGAYDHPLTAAEQKALDENPSSFADIYVMRADGSDQRRLTTAPGYDGGPFFTPDGKRIVWRRFDVQGLIADVWTMNADGSDQKQITTFAAMSWAPYMHPSGEYIFFASNKLGFENFELFIVDAAGTKEPVQVTYSPGFDGLPVPSPDGRTLAWTSSRAGGSAGQIFLGQWNHEAAMAALKTRPAPKAGGEIMKRARTALTVALALTAATALSPPHLAAQASATRPHVEALASPRLEGRLAGSAGERLASDYLTAELRRIGARPLPGRADFLLPFEFTAGTRDGGTTMTIGGAPAGAGGVRALSFSDNGDVSGQAVFAGYGLVVPDSQGLAYDSYAALDVKDRIVVVLRYFPEQADQKTRGILARYADLRYKAMAARQHGAKALVVVTGPRSPNAGELAPMTFDTAIAGSGIVAVSVTGDVAARLFTAAGQSLAAAQQSLDGANPHVSGFALPNVTLAIHAAVEREKRTGHNVVGYLPATPASAAATAKPWVAIGAHYNHLGRGEAGNTLAGQDDAAKVHTGADDNASGSAAVLAVAAALAREPRRRNVLLGFWSGEELGLLGSAAFAAAPPVPLEAVAAYLNFDMVGRMRDNKLTVQAAGSSPAWSRILERANVAAGFDLAVQEDPYQPTDVATFNAAGVPSLSFFTGTHADYHKPSDTADKIDYEDLDRIVGLAAAIVRRIEETPEAPVFAKVDEKMQQGGGRAGVRVFTGTVPDYSTEVKGLLLGGVVGGGPAEQAGLRKGDVIVAIAGQTIANIYDYTYALDVLKIGEPVAVVYLRDGRKLETTLTPAARK